MVRSKFREGFIKEEVANENFLQELRRKAPLGYAGWWISFFMVLLMMGYIITLFLKPVPFEIEGSCNSGLIGVYVDGKFDNQPYSYLNKVYDGSNTNDFKLVEQKRYYKEPLISAFGIKNIDGLNCQFKAKGAIPYTKLLEIT